MISVCIYQHASKPAIRLVSNAKCDRDRNRDRDNARGAVYTIYIKCHTHLTSKRTHQNVAQQWAFFSFQN